MFKKIAVLMLVALTLTSGDVVAQDNPNVAPYVEWSVNGNTLYAAGREGTTETGTINFYVNYQYVGTYAIPSLLKDQVLAVVTFGASNLNQWQVIGSGYGVNSYEWVNPSPFVPPAPSEIVIEEKSPVVNEWQPTALELRFSTRLQVSIEQVRSLVRTLNQ